MSLDYEFSFRERINDKQFIACISSYYNIHEKHFYPRMLYYTEYVDKRFGFPLFTYEFLYSSKGLKTLVRGEVYNFDHRFREFDLAVYLAVFLKSEVVIGDFTGLSEFLLIKDPKEIFRTGPLYGIESHRDDQFEIDYNNLHLANDLIIP